MITNASLKSYGLKDLLAIAKTRGVTGYKAMSRDQLLRALATRDAVKTTKDKGTKKPEPKPAKAAKPVPAKSKKPDPKPVQAKPAKPKAATASAAGRKATKPEPKKTKANPPKPNPKPNKVAKAAKPVVSAAKAERISRRINEAAEKRRTLKDLSTASRQRAKDKSKSERDRVVLLVRDSYWIHACWEVTHTAVVRAEAALAEQWHGARPVLRVIEVDSGPTTSAAEKVSRDIEVHGGVQNWYIEVPDPPKSYRAELGYLATNGKFFTIAKSNVVTTPEPGSGDSIDENWASVAKDADKIYALSGGYSDEHVPTELRNFFEERLRRPMNNPLQSSNQGAERLVGRAKEFQFHVDAALVIFGKSLADAKVLLDKKPARVREDGTFTEIWPMPDKRQVIPITAQTGDGVEKRVVVISVERNTKALEPTTHDNGDS